MLTPKIDLLKEAYAIIEGIPPEAINLGQWKTKEGETLEQGTVCCPATWLTQHPQFQELGLYEDGRGRPAYGPYRGYAALGTLFRIDTQAAHGLFCPMQTTLRNVPDKDVFLARLRAYINKHQPKRPPEPKL